MIEPEQAASCIWKLRGDARKLQLNTEVKLDTVLHSLPEDLQAQRWLALHLSHSLLHLYESPWLAERWTKEKITFFVRDNGVADLARPYVTTNMRSATAVSAGLKVDLNQTHGNPSILSLGIILLEIHTGKSIESYRPPEDLLNGTDVNANTDLTVAKRVAESMKSCSDNYKDAVEAYLSMPWKIPGKRVSLDDEATRDSVYEHVISPLEQDLEYLFRIKF